MDLIILAQYNRFARFILFFKEYMFTPAKTLTLRTIGGILDFYFIVDDHPEAVLQSYHQVL